MGCSISCITVSSIRDVHEENAFETEEFFDAFELTEEDMHFTKPADMMKNFRVEDLLVQIAQILDNPSIPSEFRPLKNNISTVSNLLTTGLYRQTHPMMSRNVLDLPAISYLAPPQEAACVTYARSFYNHTQEVAFCSRETTIDAVTNLASPSIVQALESVVDTITPVKDTLGVPNLRELEIPQTLPVFSQIQLQQRRAGIMLEHTVAHHRWSVTAQVPLYYFESNFIASDETQRRIENSPGILRFSSGESSSSDVEELLKAHLVADRIGFGDIRITPMYAIRTCYPLSVWGGIEATLPSAFSFSEGIIGGDFKENPAQPFGIIRDIINQLRISSNAGTQRSLEGVLEVLDRLTRIFADRSLGQEHLGIGPILSWHYDAASCDITGTARLAYLAPRTRTRFFIEPITRAELKEPDYTSQSQATENFDFLEARIINTLLPQAREAEVRPGISPRVNIALGQTFHDWRWRCGGDFWYQQEERITLEEQPKHRLNVPAAERPSAYQVKLFGDVSMDVATRHYMWHTGIALDGTIASRAIGHDVTIGIYAGTTW